MKAEGNKRVVTIKRVRLDDSSENHNPPVPGTMAERISLAWELTREAVSLGGTLDAEQRLQRHITRTIKP